MEFYKFNRTKVDLVEYVNDYLEQHDENTIEIMVGTDSQTRGNLSQISLVSHRLGF